MNVSINMHGTLWWNCIPHSVHFLLTLQFNTSEICACILTLSLESRISVTGKSTYYYYDNSRVSAYKRISWWIKRAHCPETFRETNLITEGVENTLSHIASQIDSSKLDFWKMRMIRLERRPSWDVVRTDSERDTFFRSSCWSVFRIPPATQEITVWGIASKWKVNRAVFFCIRGCHADL